MKRGTGHGILASIEALPEQVLAGWRSPLSGGRFVSKNKPSSVVVAGMGGSALGADVIQSAYADRLLVPFSIASGYSLPHWVGRNTLVILSSHSGNTEETLAAAKQAIAKKARIAVLTKGGTLLEMAKAKKWPYVLIDIATNPSNQPRMAIGSSAFALAGLLARAGVLNITDREVASLAAFLRKTSTDKMAARLAKTGVNDLLLFIASEHLTGASHVFNNQFNENAKHLSTYLALPELNHHLLEGLSFPVPLKKNLLVVFFQSDLYHPQNQKRVKLTAKEFAAQGIKTVIITPEGKTRLEQAWHTIQFGSRVSLAMAHLHKIDPEPVPIVERFKRLLA